MIRAFFFGLGLWTLLGGLSLAWVERAALRLPTGAADDVPFARVADGTVWWEPPQWVPFAAASLGAVVTLYAAALPGRVRDEE